MRPAVTNDERQCLVPNLVLRARLAFVNCFALLVTRLAILGYGMQSSLGCNAILFSTALPWTTMVSRLYYTKS